jgi:hypothetical protein
MKIEYPGQPVPNTSWTTQPTLLIYPLPGANSRAGQGQLVITLKQDADTSMTLHGLDPPAETVAPSSSSTSLRP